MFVPYTDLLNDPFYLLINLVIILGCVIAGYYNVMQYTHAFSRGTKMSLFLVAGLFSPLGKGSYRFLIAWLLSPSTYNQHSVYSRIGLH